MAALPDRTQDAVVSAPATGAEVLAAAFARHGIDVVFGQSIPSLFHLAAPANGIRQCPYRAENAGGAMADGYSRIAHRAGVVTAQNGPAATLLVPPLAEALKASTAVVALVQEVDRDIADRNAFQELDHLALFAPVSKWVRRVDHADRIDDYVDMAFTAATAGRPGPAVLLVPGALLAEPAMPGSRRGTRLSRVPLDRCLPDPVTVEKAAERLAAAREPLVIAGGGVHTADACEALAMLQQRCHLPVATTLMGKGAVDENHPLSIGVVGYAMGEGSRTAALFGLVRRADVVLLVGTRTNQNGTHSWRLLPARADYIHLDVDPAEIGRNYESIRLVGDARLGLESLTAALSRRSLDARKARREVLEREIAAARDRFRVWVAAVAGREENGPRPERLMAELDKRLGADDIVVADASYASVWVGNSLTAKKAGARFLAPRGLAGLGWGLPMAIGAALAAPGRRVVCVTGDGGFAHCWAELEIAVRLSLAIPVIVLNNQSLGFQRDAEDVMFGDHTDACHLGPVDHAAIAVACGARGMRVAHGDDIPSAIDAALDHDGPTVIDVLVDPQARPPLSFYRNRLPPPPGAPLPGGAASTDTAATFHIENQ